MANLVTEKQKKVVRKDYLRRLISVFLFIPLSLLGVFLLAYVVIYYIFLVRNDFQVIEQSKSSVDIEDVSESLKSVVNKSSDELKTVELYYKSDFQPSTYFKKIIASKDSNIKITKLAFSFLKKGQGQLSVAGSARNREDLIDFIANLKSKAGFPSVEYPVSNFAKEHDIPFNLNITVNI